MSTADALIAALGGLTPVAGPIPVTAGTALMQPDGERLVPAIGAGLGSTLGALGGGVAGGVTGAGLGGLGMGLYEKYRDMPWYEELLGGRDPRGAAEYGARIGAPIGGWAGALGGGVLGAREGLSMGRENVQDHQGKQRALGQQELLQQMLAAQSPVEGGAAAEAEAPQTPPAPKEKEEKTSAYRGANMDYGQLAAGMGAIACLNQRGVDHQAFYKVAMQSGDEVLVELAEALNAVYATSQHEKTASTGQLSVISQLEQIIFG